ncbi:MAG TPA: trypsin-like serine protease [Gaiellaceae bacterium]
MKKRILAALAAVLATGSIVGGALAITNGQPDGNRHPEVGALLAQHAFSDGTWEECTGTLIAPRVFLTAEHCDEGVSRVEVTFASSFDRTTSPTYWGTWHGDPRYGKSQSDPHDIAVVVLDDPVSGITPAELPAAGSLNGVSGSQQFTSVGYGAQAVTNGPGGKTFHYADVRYFSVGTLNSAPGNGSWLRISQNASTGNGGTCYGDSGGPNFLGAGAAETRIVAATTITGDTGCRSTNVDYRLDSPSARAFLAQFVSLP